MLTEKDKFILQSLGFSNRNIEKLEKKRVTKYIMEAIRKQIEQLEYALRGD